MGRTWITLTRWHLLLAAIWTPSTITGQEPVAHLLVATVRCVDCHFPRQADSPNPFEQGGGFCQREQSAIWEQLDKHHNSFDLISQGEGRKLTERILGFKLDEVLDLAAKERAGIKPAAAFRDLPGDDPRLAAVQSCLACHAPVQEDPEGAGVRFVEFGVSCQACHGPGSNYVGPHQELKWRRVNAEVKEKKFGLRDLRNPVTRAALCASCHVGSFAGDPYAAGAASAAAARFVKHEWYAKGHPPLPGLEVTAFAAQMPAHWQSIASKLAKPQPIQHLAGPLTPAQKMAQAGSVPALPEGDLSDNYLAANAASFSSQPTADMGRTKDVLIGALSVLANSAALVAEAPHKAANDFALFDCGACHHELRSDFAATTRPLRGLPPGRPPGPEWPRPLAALAAGEHAELAKALAALDASYAARPFGQSEPKRKAAEDVRDACRQLATGLVRQPLDEAAAAEILRQLTDEMRYQARGELRDYHSARQLAWAAREIALDLAGVPLRENSHVIVPAQAAEFRASLGTLLGVLPSDQPEVVRRQIQAIFSANYRPDPWDGPLRLKLPAGQDTSILDNLPESLTAISSYDSDSFAERLKLIHERLVAKPQ